MKKKLEAKCKKNMSTGFCDLDYFIKGLDDEKLIIIGSRPAIGKTTLALNIASNMAIKNNISVAIFSLEMSKLQLKNRILFREALVDINKIRTEKIDDDDWIKLEQASEVLSEAQIFIDDTPGISITEIIAKCKKMKLENDIGLVVIDYLQLVQVSDEMKKESREQEIFEISYYLKKLAKEINVSIIAVSQLSYEPERRLNHRPQLSDFQECSLIVQHADIVMLLYRDDYYNQDSEKKNIVEIILSKNRYGDTGTIELSFLKNYLSFVDIK